MKRERRGCNSIYGGNSGASDYGVKTFGAAGQQHPVPGGGNLIAMNGNQMQNGGNQMPMQQGGNQIPIQQGGNPMDSMNSMLKTGGDNNNIKYGGKTVVGDLLVPAGLLFARQRLLRRSKKGNKKYRRSSRRNRRSRRRR